MSKEPKEPKAPAVTPGVGLDCGTMNFVAARKHGQKIDVKRVRDAFIDLPPENRRMLKMSATSYVEMGGRLIVVGDAALETANFVNRDARRPMAGGVISAGELDAQQIIALIMKEVLGAPSVQGEKCCYSVPAPALDVQGSDITYHSRVLGKVLSELGYSPECLNEALAVVLSECSKEQFSGIGISYGSGMTNVCLAFNGMSVFDFSLARGGDWVDFLSAKAVGTTSAKVCSIKEGGVDIMNPEGREQEAIAYHIQELIDYTIEKIIEAFSAKKSQLHITRPIPVIVSGGTSKARGFDSMFQSRFASKKASFPIAVSEVRPASDPMHAVAHGLLLMAQSDDD